MEHIFELFYQTLITATLVISTTIGIWGLRQTEKLVDLSKNHLNSNPILFENQGNITLRHTKSYEEILGILLTELEVDLFINGMILEAEEYNYRQFDFSQISDTDYTEEQILDQYGKLTGIIYESI